MSTISIETVIIGGGPAGLAMSRQLTEAGVEHVIIERGRLAERWRSERWDSLRLLTPNWQTRLPGWSYTGPDPEGFMTGGEVVDHLVGYGRSFSAPIEEFTEVELVGPTFSRFGHGFEVQTSGHRYRARTVVVATGATDTPAVPGWAAGLGGAVQQVASTRYRNPEMLADGAVLVVGASASGLQIADELARSGREVLLSVGSHTRLPRTYRGLDIHWWMDAAGVLDTRFDEVGDLAKARRSPSLQLVGSPDRRSIDLNSVAGNGVRLLGRAVAADDGVVRFRDDLADVVTAADGRQRRLLDRLDAHATSAGLDDEILPRHRPDPITVPAPVERIDVGAEGIGTVLWATGFRRRYPWLNLPVLDDRGEISHRGGVGDWPGLYVLGLPFLRRRKSTFLDGFGPDATDLTAHLVRYLDRTAARTGG